MRGKRDDSKAIQAAIDSAPPAGIRVPLDYDLRALNEIASQAPPPQMWEDCVLITEGMVISSYDPREPQPKPAIQVIGLGVGRHKPGRKRARKPR